MGMFIGSVEIPASSSVRLIVMRLPSINPVPGSIAIKLMVSGRTEAVIFFFGF
jgi:hypothetical protein